MAPSGRGSSLCCVKSAFDGRGVAPVEEGVGGEVDTEWGGGLDMAGGGGVLHGQIQSGSSVGQWVAAIAAMYKLSSRPAPFLPTHYVPASLILDRQFTSIK